MNDPTGARSGRWVCLAPLAGAGFAVTTAAGVGLLAESAAPPVGMTQRSASSSPLAESH